MAGRENSHAMKGTLRSARKNRLNADRTYPTAATLVCVSEEEPQFRYGLSGLMFRRCNRNAGLLRLLKDCVSRIAK